MKAVKMPISDLKKPNRNVRIHTEVQLKEFERSVTMFGQLRPIVVDENLEILAGNGLYETLIRLGIKEADVYIMEGLTSKQKKKLMLADNKVYSLGIDDMEALDAFLVELDGDFDIPGFDEDILRNMVSVPDDITETMSEYGKIGEDEVADLAAAHERMEKKTASNSRDEAFANASVESSDGAQGTITCPNCGAEICL